VPIPSTGGRGLKKSNFFLECNTRGRELLSSPSVALGEEIFSKKTADGSNGVKSSPSARMTLGRGFPESTIFDTRGRPLSRERHPRRLFPECCTRGRLPQVFLCLPRVHLAFGEACVSRSGVTIACKAVARELGVVAAHSLTCR
jgi:hypothetical protein